MVFKVRIRVSVMDMVPGWFELWSRSRLFNDKSMKVGTLLEYTFLVIFGYRVIADSTCDKIGSHFPIWPPSSLGKRGFVWENCGTYLFSVDFYPLWGSLLRIQWVWSLQSWGF